MKVLIGCGGTGGHINPALAIAKYIAKRNPGSEIVFCGSKGGMEEKLVPREGFRLETFEIHGFRRNLKPAGIVYNVKNLQNVLRTSKGARALVQEFAPDIVIGCGGYASYPVVHAAQKLGIANVILEVNALAGMTTKVLSKKADCTMICFEQTRAQVSGSRIVLTGSPVREDILFADHDAARRELGLDARPLIVSVWGSLGAQRMNELMCDFSAMEAEQDRHQLIHAIGSYGYTWVPDRIREKGVELSAHPNIDVRDYIYDAARVYAAADLILCRAGASTLGEMAVMGKPVILVPSPNVAENHQEKNARALEAAGGAVVLLEKELTAQVLYKTASELLADPEKCRALSRNIRKFAKPDALENIYACIEQTLADRK